MVSDAAGDVGEVEPDLDAAEVRAFGADGRSNTGAEIAGRADVPSVTPDRAGTAVLSAPGRRRALRPFPLTATAGARPAPP